jgi:hypothetical protein
MSRKVDECKPLPSTLHAAAAAAMLFMSSAVRSGAILSSTGGRWPPSMASRAATQGLTLVHLSALIERILWNRGCIEGLFRGCLGGVRGY